MSLSYEELELYLNKIASGVDYIYINNRLLFFKFPSHKVLQMASLVYEKSLNEAKESGILTVSELESILDKRNIITDADKNKLKKLKGQLEAQEILLGKTTMVKANQDRIKSAIKRIKYDIKEIEFKKKSKLLMSAETKAEEDKTLFICSKCVFNADNENNTLFWDSYESALKETNLNFKDKIILLFLKFYSGFSVKIIREIARSSLWRVRYISSIKTSDPLFGVPATSYTTDQLNLSYWSNYYQNIYEMMPEDRPSDIIIEDDESLDAYMKTFYEERNRQDAERRHNQKRSGKLSAFDAEEVIVTRSHELYQDIEYDKPREARKIKDRTDLRKRTKRG